MNSELVNCTQCAKILSQKLNRSIKREFIARLASDGRVPYHLLNGKKHYNIDEVEKSLPPERLTSSYKGTDKVLEDENIPTKEDIITHFKKEGLNIVDPFTGPTKKTRDLPRVKLPTLQEVKEKLNIIELTATQKAKLTDVYIEQYIKEFNPSYEQFNGLWNDITNGRFIDTEYREIFNAAIEEFSDNQKSFLLYAFMNSFCNAELIADSILDEINI